MNEQDIQAIHDEAERVCSYCRELGWPINDEHGRLFHVHDFLEDAPPCKAQVVWDKLWGTARVRGRVL
jgi:hypothetical protein